MGLMKNRQRGVCALMVSGGGECGGGGGGRWGRLRLGGLERRTRSRDYTGPVRVEDWGGRPRDGECGHLGA